MSEVSPIGIPNLLSQGDVLARTRGAQAGAEQVLKEQAAVEVRRAADRRAEQVQASARIGAAGRRRREDDRRGSRQHHDLYDAGDEEPEDGDEGHRLDVSA